MKIQSDCYTYYYEAIIKFSVLSVMSQDQNIQAYVNYNDINVYQKLLIIDYKGRV